MKSWAQVPLSAYVNFEGAQTNPIRLSPDGTRLFVVNTADARLSVFDVTAPSSPKLIAEIPVGIEPVSVNPRTNDEAWVVNQESDSVSVVSVAKGIVTDTIFAKDEPADVVFAGSNAFVSISRSNAVYVYDAGTHAPLKTIPLAGGNPRALAVSADGTRVYVLFALSGNHTTIIPPSLAPAQTFPPGATAPVPAPQVALIADARDTKWSSYIKFTMPDNDIALIDTAGLTVLGYVSGVGTINLGMAVRPSTGELYVANTDALNLTHYETFLRGHWVNNRITRVAGSSLSFYDLNPGINYGVLPNPAAQATALAQPTAIVFHPSGAFLYVAAFGTDRVGLLDPNGNILGRIELEPTALGSAVDPAHKRGPRGLALNATGHMLYVENRISNSISIVDISKNTVISEIPVGTFDPTPPVIKNGRGFLYDAKLSGNGTGSCASCHIDGDMDHLAWDLGNPFGSVTTFQENTLTIQFHPMKGPMTTQTLRGLAGLSPYHWRGDKQAFAAFNPAFDALMGGTQLSSADITAYTNYINTIVFQPNPFQNLDRSLPTSLSGGNAANGRTVFLQAVLSIHSTRTCDSCHTSNPGAGTSRFIQPPAGTLDGDQPLKIPQLRNVYQKLLYNKTGPSSIDGFGLNHNGDASGLGEFLSAQVFADYSQTQKNDIAAYSMCFDTGMAPAVGYARTVRGANVLTTSVQNDLGLLQSQAAAGNIDLIAKGTLSGHLHGLLYRPASNDYITDQTGLGPFVLAQIRGAIVKGDTLTFMGVPPGSGVRMGIDRDLNGILDGDQH
ncbi:MAG TPA: beta-propeller fold lactonase family protein [Bryobacteraceae bacterium]|nr:beta-propeller fold lactonase family protein [Bryobacteraceae bacterium]